jgi:hypothetical protein
MVHQAPLPDFWMDATREVVLLVLYGYLAYRMLLKR